MTHTAQQPGTPDLLALHELDPARYPFLLQSVAGHPVSGRYDLLFAFPQWDSAETVREGPDFFARLSAAVSAAGALPADALPFAGGWFVFLGYEAARFIETRLKLPASPYALPDAIAVRCPAAVIVDREAGLSYCISESDPAQLHAMQADLARIAQRPSAVPVSVLEVREEPSQQYLDGCQRVLDYLVAGDSFQINLSRAWQAGVAPGTPSAALYRSLRDSNPAPFSGLAVFAGSAVISSSPERLISIDQGRVETRPIAGTRPRGESDAEDVAFKSQLVGSLKERAEHVMLIDLERNDLGRVCQPGSVEVSELMTVESYAHVHHIVSNVRGRLRPGVGVGEAIAAVFPGGTITGCPKLRAMEIIAELEGVGRGPYTGAMGYISRHGRSDLNILIRSLVLEDDTVSFRAGAGIVADSVPELELAETRTKARGLLRALGVAG
ncbi:MAG: aminodeoxychorismate synthase component I [Pseudomonadota bacterium]